VQATSFPYTGRRGAQAQAQPEGASRRVPRPPEPAARRIRDLYARTLKFADILTPEFLQCPLSHSGGRPMDVVYVGLAVVFWLLLAGMARGCALLAGGSRP